MIFYYCTCRGNKEGEGYHLTLANSDGVCNNCGYYAVASKNPKRLKVVDEILKIAERGRESDEESGPSSLIAIRNKRRKNENTCRKNKTL